MYDAKNPVKSWDLREYNAEALADMWQAFNALPLGSVIAVGFEDDGLVYWEKTNDLGEYTVLQADHPGVADVFHVGLTSADRLDIDAGGDIEVAYVIREGAAA